MDMWQAINYNQSEWSLFDYNVVYTKMYGNSLSSIVVVVVCIHSTIPNTIMVHGDKDQIIKNL